MAEAVVYFLRHGQSAFNEAFSKDRTRDPMIFDPHLTALGRTQATEAGKMFREISLDLVVTSPFARALQTTQLAFGSRCLKIAVGSLHGERLEQSCDVGNPKSKLTRDFPEFDFTDIPEIWWHVPDLNQLKKIVIEPEEIVSERIYKFRSWLATRSERCIVIVGHGGFFRRMTGRHLQNGEWMEYVG
ncbi:histidine phosphatase family protein [Agrobacterium rhizogenes]|nr:histidine phosphatase family protein [Rhizobium rhizogenes]